MLQLKTFLFYIFMLGVIPATAQELIQLKNSYWLQEGYGRALAIKDSTYSYYNLDSKTCRPLAEGIFSDRFSIISSSDSLLIINPGGIVNYTFRRIKSLPEICSGIQSGNVSMEENFEIFWQTFNDNYAFFKERDVNWKQLHDDYLPVIRNLKSEQDFAAVLREIVGKLKDGHIRLDIPQNVALTKTPAASTPLKSKLEVINDLGNNYLQKVRHYNGGLVKWGLLKNSNIGYLVITDMNNFAEYVNNNITEAKDFRKEYEKVSETKAPLELFTDELHGVEKVMKLVLDDFKQTSSVVIDLRYNGGGYETVALKLLSYFVTEKKEVLSIRAKMATGLSGKQNYVLVPAKDAYRKKVYLLLSQHTASAAEIFALGTLSYPKIQRIGSPTAGIFSELLWKELPNGWEYSLSNEVYSDSKSKSYEGIGIPVNYEMNYQKDRSKFYDEFYSSGKFVDKTIEKVLQLNP